MRSGQQLKRGIFIATGFVSLSLGVAGVFVPLLPTTPFLLLSAWLWVRSSDKLYGKLIGHKRIGKYIRDYMENRRVPVKVKVYALSLLWISMSFCIFSLFSGRIYLQIGLGLVALGVSGHIIALGRRGKKKKDFPS